MIFLWSISVPGKSFLILQMSSLIHLTVTDLSFFPLFFQSLSPQRLAYSPGTPVGDAAKLYWHFFRADQSGAAGVIITLFLYAVLSLLSITILSIYLLRWDTQGNNDLIPIPIPNPNGENICMYLYSVGAVFFYPRDEVNTSSKIVTQLSVGCQTGVLFKIVWQMLYLSAPPSNLLLSSM